MNLMAEVLERFEAHAASGEPLDGLYYCSLCQRGPDDGVRQYVVKIVTPRERSRTEGARAVIRGKNRELIDFQYRLVCPCCSTTTCPHRASAMSCPSCGRPVGPGWATQCPFAGEHPAVST